MCRKLALAILLGLASAATIPLSSAAIVPGSKDLGAIWCIGDSIMESVADGYSGSPRSSLYGLLSAANYTFTFTGDSNTQTGGLPVTGSTTADNLYQYHSGHSGYLIDGIRSNLTSYWTASSSRLSLVKPNVIVLMIGTNDINNNNNISGAPARLTLLLNAIYSLPGIGNPTIFVSTIPPNKTTNGGVSAQDHFDQVIAFNNSLQGIVQSFDGAGKDVYLSDAWTPLNANYSAAMRPDNLHPNGPTGNDLLAQTWFNSIDNRVTAVPEPSLLNLVALGFLVLLATRAKGWLPRRLRALTIQPSTANRPMI